MLNKFEQGRTIKTTDLREITINKYLGGGGQGDVYQVEFEGKAMALKWYKPGILKDVEGFKSNLENNINKKAPSSAFLWPEALTEEIEGSFGYVMKLRTVGYEDFPMILKAKVRLERLQSIQAALEMVNAYKLLHRKGFNYQDLNDGNFFIEPSSGNILICDNDNVSESGFASGIGGKPGYMAPEVVMGIKKPNEHTDKFSLAVILFLLLVRARPFEGQMTTVPCLTEELEKKFFGEDPVFIFHPTDGRNRPILGVHNNAIIFWPMLPEYMQKAFEKTFVNGIDKGNNEEQDRTTANEWEKLLLRLRDESVVCGSCGWETIYYGAKSVCMKCGADIVQKAHLAVNNYKVVLDLDSKIYGNHIDKPDEFSEIIGQVVANKKDPSLWGIKNLSDIVWQEIASDGTTRNVEKDGAVRILTGYKVSFGNGIIGEIKL